MRRLALALAILFLASLASAQGGLGGGLQGGAQGPLGGERIRERPEEQDGPLWSERTAIVTPGDRVEYKLTVKQGQAIFAAAESDAFDPALAVEDAKGKTLVKNDDRAEGDQTPFLAFRFPADGIYTLKVLGFRGAAGGRFTLKTRLLAPFDAALKPTIDEGKPDDPREAGRTSFRLTLKKGQIVDPKRVTARTPYQGDLRLVRLVGPTGVGENDFERVETDDGAPVFAAKADGDYYLDYAGDRPAKVETDFREVAVVQAPTAGDVSLDFAPGELKIVEMPVKPNLVVWTKIQGQDLAARVSAPAGTGETAGGDPTHGSAPAWSWFIANREHGDPDLDQIHVFQAEGTARFIIRSAGGAPQRVMFRNAESLPVWPEGQTVTGRLEIGEARYFLLPAKRSEIMRVMARASAFQIRLDLFRLSGGPQYEYMDRSTRSAGGDLYFGEPQTLVARITCDGYGGSGEFTLRRDTPTPAPYARGSVGTVALSGSGFTLFAVDLEAGNRYQLTRDHADHGLDLTVLAEDGTPLPLQAVTFDPVQVIYFTPPGTGRYRLWFRGGPGEWRFKVEPFAAPSVGAP